MDTDKKYGINHRLGFFPLTCEEDSKDPSLLHVSIHWPVIVDTAPTHSRTCGGIMGYFDKMWLCSVHRGDTDYAMSHAYSAAVKRLEEVQFWDGCYRRSDQSPCLSFLRRR